MKSLSKSTNTPNSPPAFLDLFCGCGGFTLGMMRAGFRCVAAIDFDPRAVSVLKENLGNLDEVKSPTAPQILERDLTSFTPNELASLTKVDQVDVIVGGPPCQGFSTARQVDGANHGDRLKEDPRRHLYRYFLKYIDYFQPKVFVMENVLGLRTAAGGQYFTKVQSEARSLGRASGKPGYRVQSQIEDAWMLGVPQKRRRQLIIGVRNDLPGYFPTELHSVRGSSFETTLGAAIGDLPALKAGDGLNECTYDLERRRSHYDEYGKVARWYLQDVLEIGRAKKLTNHISRPHNSRDLRDFNRLREGENSLTALRDRGVEFEFPYDRNSFKDRYTRQSRSQACSTIVAHLAKDGLMFIHPTQPRSLTPREAARIQSFPDWFKFPEARTHAFRMIGNAVPPLIGRAIGEELRNFLEKTLPNLEKRTKSGISAKVMVPDSVETAAAILAPFAAADKSRCKASTRKDLLCAWGAMLYLFPGLHPENAADHGPDLVEWEEGERLFPYLTPDMKFYYDRSGWPIAFTELADEAWRRYRAKEFSEEEFYCVDAQMAGLGIVRELIA